MNDLPLLSLQSYLPNVVVYRIQEFGEGQMPAITFPGTITIGGPVSPPSATTLSTVYDPATKILTTVVNGVTKTTVISGPSGGIAGLGLTGTGEAATPFALKIDPASTAPVTVGPNGLKVDCCPPVASKVTTFTHDKLGRTITVAVDGTAAMTIDVSSLDDEAVSMEFTAGYLVLKNAADTVLSTTPIPDRDAQTLTLGKTTVSTPIALGGGSYSAQPTITISGGNTITLPPARLRSEYAPSYATATQVSIFADGGDLAVVIPAYAGQAVGLGLVPRAPAAPLVGKFLQADGVWATPVIPTTLHVNTWTKADGLKESVNNVPSNIAIPLGVIVDDIGYDASGNPVYQPVKAIPDFFSSVTATPDTVGSPDSLTDRTEKIRRDGSVGLYVDPLTTFHNGGSYSLKNRQLTMTTTPDVVTPVDSVISLVFAATNSQEIVFPPAASYKERILTVRMPVAFLGSQAIVRTASGSEMTHPGHGSASAALFPFIVMDDRSVAEATWQSNGSQWVLINWTERAYYATRDYTAPSFGVTTFNNGGVAAPVGGSPYQVAPGATVFQTRDGDYTPLIKLPLTNNATGRFSVYCNSGVGTQIDWRGTDLPQNAPLAAYGESMHFEWSNGLWRWVYAPEANPTMPMYSYKNPNPLPVSAITPNTNTPSGSGKIVNGTAAFLVLDGNYVPLVTLPAVTAASVPIVIQRSSAFPVAISSLNTDMPTNLNLGAIEAGRFFPSTADNKWHWVGAEMNPVLPSGAGSVSPTGLLTMGGQSIQLVKLPASVGNFWAFPG
jgi:hypothetical protein